jgi:toxin ParE1/3/4
LSLLITDTAEDDLADIWTFIAAENPDAATRFVRDIHNHLLLLCDNPELGPRRDQLAEGLRAHFFRNYVIYYRVTNTSLTIMRVLHGARDAAALIGDSEDKI